MKAWAKKAWTWIKGLFDSSTAESRAATYADIDRQKEAAIARIDSEERRDIARREAERQRKREESAAVHEATMAEIGRQNLAKHHELDAEYERRMAENESDLAKARREWQEAIEAARKKRQAKEAEGPGKLEEPDDIIAQANRALAGLGDLLAGQAARIGAQGTFVAANVLGLQAGGVSDRMAEGIDKIERNTRPLREADEISFT